MIKLAYADRLLRAVRIPTLIYQAIHLVNNKKYIHFDYYMSKTEHALADFHQTLNGKPPNWHPELEPVNDLTRKQTWRKHCLESLHINHSEPIRYYSMH